MQHNHEPRSWLCPYARRLPSLHRSVSAYALGRLNPSKPRCLLTAGALNAKDRGKPPAEPDASLHSLYAETMAGHVEGEDSTETAVLTLTKKEEVAESSSSPARRGLTHPSRPRPTRHVREPTGCASGHGATNTLLQLLQHADDRLASAPISRPGSDLDVIWLRTRTPGQCRTPGASGSCPSRTVPCCRCCYSTVHTNVLCC